MDDLIAISSFGALLSIPRQWLMSVLLPQATTHTPSLIDLVPITRHEHAIRRYKHIKWHTPRVYSRRCTIRSVYPRRCAIRGVAQAINNTLHVTFIKAHKVYHRAHGVPQLEQYFTEYFPLVYAIAASVVYFWVAFERVESFPSA